MNSPAFVYLNLNGRSSGPYTLEQCAQMLAGGQILTSTLAYFGDGTWVPLNSSGYWGQIVQLSSVSEQRTVIPAPLSMGGQPSGSASSVSAPGFGAPATPVQPVGVQPPVSAPGFGAPATPVQPVALRLAMPVRPIPIAKPVFVSGGGGSIPVARPVFPMSAQGIPVAGGFSFVSQSAAGGPVTKDEFSGDASKDQSYLEPEDEELEGDDSPQMLCMHCWYLFRQSRLRYISRHPDLLGDPVLGPSAQRRFLPKRFNASDEALDDRGVACQELACPRCHLAIPKVILEYPCSLLSIVGAPSAGKSYFLTAMLHTLRQSLGELSYALVDADPTHNMVLSHYEELLFENHDEEASRFVALPKTELQGEGFCSQTQIDHMKVELPLPFVYTLKAQNFSGDAKPHNLVFYDNAGEQFEPGRDFLTRMATNHLLQSNCIFFLFDPFKDFRTLDNCSSEDPQAGVMKRTANQMQVFNEMVNRIHQKPDLSSDEPYPIPLVVVIPKYDAWKHTFGLDLAETSVIGMGKGQRPALDMSVVTLTSFLLRDWLLKLVPELVAGAEASFKEVYYLPASALGKAPMLDSQTRMLGVQPSDVQPVWADVPLLFYLWHAGFLPGIRSSVSDEVRPADEFCRFENGVMFFLPPRRKSMIVPRIYWGQVVHDDELGFIRFPSDAGTDAEEMDEELSF